MIARPLLTFYGDDFTGSADLVLQYQRFGLRGVIFLGLPSADELRAAAEQYPVIGIAGVTRAMRTSDIPAVVGPAFRRLGDLSPDVLQYKVCSTADSSPDVGSFGPAVAAGRELFGSRPVPVVVAQPGLGRFTAFSNHFAADRGVVFRLDRQPIMSNHPVTPMTEADLRLHIREQVDGPVDAIQLPDLQRPDGGKKRYRLAHEAGARAVVVDAVTEPDLERAGRLALDAGPKPAFVIGSGGMSVGIARAFGLQEVAADDAVSAAEGPCLAVSGSCSQLTREQIEHATARGWAAVSLDVVEDEGAMADRVAVVATQAIDELRNGRSVVVHTCSGHREREAAPLDVKSLSEALAGVIRQSAQHVRLRRVLIAGGDTSGHVVLALGATALRSKATVGGFTLLFELQAVNPNINGLEVVLKGGQIGDVDFFELVRAGRGPQSSIA